MDPITEIDTKQLNKSLVLAQQLAQQFLTAIDTRPVASVAMAPAFNELCDEGIGTDAALTTFWQQWNNTLSASPGPRYFGFVTGGATPAALAADWLTSSVDQNAQMGGGSQSAILETYAIRQFCQGVGLPSSFTGGMVSGATMANLCGLAIGREYLGKQRGLDVAADGWSGKPLLVLSGGIHSSAIKACSVLGLGRNAVKTLTMLPGRESVDVHALENALKHYADHAVIVVANAGTVNTVDFDNLSAIAELKKRYSFWLHVDAAFGGIAAFSERYRSLLNGWEQADSITVDAHKWLNVPYDSALILTRHLATQIDVFQNRSRYLSAPEAVPENLLHLMPENSRRWRALPLFVSLLAYGRRGIADMVERHIELTKKLADGISKIEGLTLLSPPRLNGVCFALTKNANDAAADRNAYLKRLNEDGICYFTPTVHGDRFAIRGALVNWRTTEHDIDMTLRSLRKCMR